MAFDQSFLKFTWGFTIFGTDEIAVTSLNLSHPTDPAFNAVAALAEIVTATTGPLLQAHMTALIGSAPIRWANYSRLNYVRMAAVLATGFEDPVTKTYVIPSPPAGGLANVVPQCSIVGTLRSGSVVGSANYGRMYLPHTQLELGTGLPNASPTDTGTAATRFQTFVTGVNDDVNAVVTESVRAMIMTQVPAATSKVVNQVSIGDVNDTQRRRRNQLRELHQLRSIP